MYSEHYVSDHLSGLFGTTPRNLRSYTGHEPVALGDDNRILHMNGRIYDADTGRVMQADPVVQAPMNLQNYNAYSYVLNNPLSYTDPSGYLFKKLLKASMKLTGDWYVHKFLNKVPWLKSIVSVALNFIPSCQVWCTAVFTAQSNFVATGSLNGALKAGAISALSAYAFSQIGDAFGAESGFWETGGAAHIGAHALTGGVISELQGGKFGHGFLSAGLTKGAQVAGLVSMDNIVIGTAQSMVVSGTISKLTGGKFANAAVTGAFQYLYNAKGKSFAKSGKNLLEWLLGGRNLTPQQRAAEYGRELMDAGLSAEEATRRANKEFGNIHGNSKSSLKEQHLYLIEDVDGNIKKIGISGQPLNKNGSSPRANTQLTEGDTAVILESGIPGRATALQKEGQVVEGLRKAGYELPDQKRPKIK
nr:RHS repeat-associated core domain-containing protein [Pseudoalteromonas luteoviolacea]